MTKSNWKKCRLSDIADVRDGTHDSPKEVTGYGFPLVTSRHICNGKIDLSNTYNISEKDYNDINLRSKVNLGDILISMIGTVGQIAYVNNTPQYAIKNIGLIKPNDLESSKYIFYYLQSPIAQEDILSRLKGTTQQYLSLGELRNFPILLPSLEEQKRIAEVLGAFDDKIELLQKQNKTLEEMAKAIFKSWFVDFDVVKAKQKGDKKEDIIKNYHLTEELYNLFPSSFEQSSLGPIPTGWQVKKLSEITNISSGKRPKKTQEYKDINYSVPVYGGNGIKWWTNIPLFTKPLIITGRVGTLGQVYRIYNPVWVSDNALIFETDTKNFEYLFYFLQSVDFDSFNRGSTQPLITQGDIKNISAVFCEQIINNFHNIVAIYERKVLVNKNQIQTLTGLRDTLLPRLISGKIKV
jgi:type I restriction enzyme S subunit